MFFFTATHDKRIECNTNVKWVQSEQIRSGLMTTTFTGLVWQSICRRYETTLLPVIISVYLSEDKVENILGCPGNYKFSVLSKVRIHSEDIIF